MNDLTHRPDVNGHIEIIEIDEDEVLAEFQSEESPSFVPAAAAPGEFDVDAFLAGSDEFLPEPSLITVASGDEVVEEFPTELVPSAVPGLGAGRRRPMLVAVATIAGIAITGLVSFQTFVRSGQRAPTVTATNRSDVVSIEAPSQPERSAQQADAVVAPTPIQTAPIQTAPIAQSAGARAERPAQSSPAAPVIAERLTATTGTGLANARSPVSRELLASNRVAPTVGISPAPTANLVVPPAPTAPTVSTDAIARPPVEPAPANIVEPARPAVAAIVTPTDAIQRTLRQYQIAFSRLDVAAVRQVWPSVDGKALTKAFDQVEEENLAFDSCDITVSGRRAVASCGGSTYYVPKVGSKNARVQRQQWRISLRQTSDDWVVDSVDVTAR
jgi:hypothetical protein